MFSEATVLAAARQQFWTSGYAATSLEDVVAATGLSKGSIYNAFGGKRSLYLRAFEGYCDEVVDQVAALMDGPDHTAVDGLRTLMHGIVGAADPSTVPRACFLAKAAAELAASDPEVKTLAQRTFGRLETHLRNGVTAAQRAGDIDSSRNPERVARQLLVALRGLEALAAAGVDYEMRADAARGIREDVLGLAG
jgi:TetR/AcrR family transcriptional repressor of nem operon